MRLAVGLGLAFIVANAASWLLITGDAALTMTVGFQLVLLLVLRHFVVGYGSAGLEARLNVLVLAYLAIFAIVVTIQLREVLAA